MSYNKDIIFILSFLINLLFFSVVTKINVVSTIAFSFAFSIEAVMYLMWEEKKNDNVL